LKSDATDQGGGNWEGVTPEVVGSGRGGRDKGVRGGKDKCWNCKNRRGAFKE